MAPRRMSAACSLVDRFREANQIGRIKLAPTALILRSRAQHGVSKDGHRRRPRPRPSFETPTFGRLLRTRSMDDSNFETAH